MGETSEEARQRSGVGDPLRLDGGFSAQGIRVGSDTAGALCVTLGPGLAGLHPTAQQPPCLTAVQQLVLHAVALQRPLAPRLLPAHSERCGSQGREHQAGGRVGHTSRQARVWGQEAAVRDARVSVGVTVLPPDLPPSAGMSTLIAGWTTHPATPCPGCPAPTAHPPGGCGPCLCQERVNPVSLPAPPSQFLSWPGPSPAPAIAPPPGRAEAVLGISTDGRAGG